MRILCVSDYSVAASGNARREHMVKHYGFNNILRRGTALAMIAAFAGFGASQAQAQDQATGDAAAAKADEPTEVVVIGTRASQRSSIDRKKRAKTATDSIIAEDVGKFPDKNIGEAISRIAGVALDRGDFNEGGEVALRGATSGQTNVELDGLGVQNTSTTNNLAFGGGSDGRGKTFQEFPADLIKSVDVVKGSTAAMTEGGLGGSIIITSRTPLDFKKPFVSFRADRTYNSLGKDSTGEYNFIATRKFLNDRLGVMINYSDSSVVNDNNAVQNSTSGNQGLARGNNPAGSGFTTGTAAFDFDNSPNKTFTFNPSTLSSTDPLATTVFANSAETPLSLLTKSASAATKADCYTMFPIIAGATATTAQRTAELQTCLNQWNDYSPSLVRYFVRRQAEHRQTLDLRADYRVNADLTVYAKFNMNKRHVDDNQLTFSEGGINVNPVTVSTPTYNGVAFIDTAGVRAAAPGSGYYLYDGVSTLGTTTASAVRGAVVNVNPATLVVDANHHVIQAEISDGNINTDQIHNTNDISSTYLSFGANFRHDRLSIDFLAGDAKSKYTRYDKRTNLSYTYGKALMSFDDTSGLWGYTLPAGLDQTNPALYSIIRPATANRNAITPTGTDPGVPGQLGAYTIAQQPLTGAAVGLQWSPRENDTETKTMKLDVKYDFTDKLPFIQNLQVGMQMRDDQQKGWSGGGITIAPENTHLGTTPYGTAGYVAPVILPRQTLRGSLRACEPSTAPGALPCNYGYLASTNLGTADEGVMTLHQADFQALVGQVFAPAWNQFFAGYPDRGNLFDGWSQIDVEKLYGLVSQASTNPAYSAGGDPLAHYNFECLKVCTASDGKTYNMPFSSSSEKTTAAYWMIEFEQNLPFNMVFNGNVGTRMVKTDVDGAGYITLTNKSCRNSANCNSSTTDNAANITTVAASAFVTVSNHTTDWMPSYNYNLWVIPDKLVARYYAARVVARPPIGQLLPAGNCTFDQRFDGATATDGSPVDAGCGNFGNPALKPFQSNNHNWSLEWYPNRDMQFSVGLFKNDIKTGAGVLRGVSNGHLLAGTGAVDPVTGQSVENREFAYSTYFNAPGFVRHGQEYAFKAALTFLPWYFKYLGVDGNYSTLHSSSSVPIRDPNTGDALPPAGESSYYGNLSLWYDDGTTNARLALQSRDLFFDCIASCGANSANNYYGEGYTNVRLPYNPGAPNFRAKTDYVDFKVSHKLRPELEVFFQANNITKQAVQKDQGIYNTYASGAPSILETGYAGYRVTWGFTYRH